MFKALVVAKELFFIAIFSVIFFVVAADIFQQFLVFVSYLIYIKIPSPMANDAFRSLMANLLILKYLRNLDTGTDQELTRAADNLLLSLQSGTSLLHITEVNPKEVVDIDSAVVFSGLVSSLVSVLFLVALVINYFS